MICFQGMVSYSLPRSNQGFPMAYIQNYEALKLPEDIETLQESIRQLAYMVRDEAPLHLMGIFKLTYLEARILDFISLKGGKNIQREYMETTFDISDSSVRYHVNSLQKKLVNQSIAIMTSYGTSIDDTGLKKVDEALYGFRAAYHETCGIVGVTELNKCQIDRPKGKRDLQEILGNLLLFIRGDPQQSPLADLPLGLSEKLVMGVYHAALSRGQTYAFKQRLIAAVFPPFTTKESDADRLVMTYQGRIKEKLSDAVKNKPQHRVYVIEEPIRNALGFSPAPPARPAEHLAALHLPADYKPG
jgi:hypothetical protein